MSIAVLFLAVLALAYTNGGNDNLKPTATVYGCGSLDYIGARRLATLAQLTGSFTSVALASSLLRTFSGKGLVPPNIVEDPGFLIAVGAGAAITVGIASRIGMPVSTTHALVGSLVGAGVMLAPSQLSWSSLGSSYFLPLLVSPLVASLATAVLYPLLSQARKQLGVDSESCVCIGGELIPVAAQPDGALVLRRTGLPLTVAQESECRSVYGGRMLGVSVQDVVDRLHLISAFALGFARSLNDTPKVLALLIAAGWAGLDPRLSLAAVALAMATGGWLRARKVAETLAHGITSINHGQGLLANSLASSLVIGASMFGAPVSTTHVTTGALFGIGVWNESTAWPRVAGILGAWLATLPLAAAVAAAVAAIYWG